MSNLLKFPKCGHTEFQLKAIEECYWNMTTGKKISYHQYMKQPKLTEELVLAYHLQGVCTTCGKWRGVIMPKEGLDGVPKIDAVVDITQ